MGRCLAVLVIVYIWLQIICDLNQTGSFIINHADRFCLVWMLLGSVWKDLYAFVNYIIPSFNWRQSSESESRLRSVKLQSFLIHSLKGRVCQSNVLNQFGIVSWKGTFEDSDPFNILVKPRLVPIVGVDCDLRKKMRFSNVEINALFL